jgi:Amt family ammonium transporter
VENIVLVKSCSTFLFKMLGTFILWFGWYGFNCGSALLIVNEYTGSTVALAAVNTTMSAGVAGITALFVNLWYLERTTGEPFFDLTYAMNGALSGLVAVTAGCGVIEPWAAVLTGIVAGLIYMVGSRGLIMVRLDDAVDAIPVHLMNGVWGCIAVGLWASPTRISRFFGRAPHPGWFYAIRDGNPGDMRLLGAQLVGLLFIIGWVMSIMVPFFIWLDWKGWFRSDPLEEIVGLDTSYHGGLALLNSHQDSVQPEYITAFKKQREEGNLRRRNNRGVGHVGTAGDSEVFEESGHGVTEDAC